MSPKARRSAKRRLRLLQSLLDFLESAAKQEGLTKLYCQLLIGTLIRSLLPHYELAKSLPRAKALGIAVNPTFISEREQEVVPRKRLKKDRFQWRRRGDGEEVIH